MIAGLIKLFRERLGRLGREVVFVAQILIVRAKIEMRLPVITDAWNYSPDRARGKCPAEPFAELQNK
jgi:hypothetical protein